MSKKKKPQEESEEDGATFDMYHLFSRWDFVLLVLFVLVTLILTILIIISGNQVV